jgi:serine O-acetyltransferase
LGAVIQFNAKALPSVRAGPELQEMAASVEPTPSSRAAPELESKSSTLRRDFARYYDSRKRLSFIRKVQLFLDTPGLQAILLYRYGNWISRAIPSRLLRLPFAVVNWMLQKLCIMCWGIYIDAGAQIGPGLYIGHFGGIIIGPIRMGQDCNIAHQVTIGLRVDGGSGVPTFGDNVWIGVGSVVYGDVRIGDGVMIGPYTVVSRSLPDRTMVLGNPLRVISTDYDNYQAIYGHPREEAASPTGL